MKKHSVVIIGPSGCGKTLNAPQLLELYELNECIDFDDYHLRVVPQYNYLILSTHSPSQIPYGVQVVEFKDAIKLVASPHPLTPNIKSQSELLSERVAALAKPGKDILATLTENQAHLLHMALGLSGEVGELQDAIKKAIIYCRQPDHENIVEELGDIEFYLEGIRQGFGIERNDVLVHNAQKLANRYSEGSYSDQQAQDRADKCFRI